jgi:HEAT repeat protein
MASILAVRDPNAVPGVKLLMRSADSRPIKMLWVHTLANIGSPEALQTLVDVVLQEPDLEIVHGCLDCLANIQSPLVQRQFQESLRHESNQFVNRSALALGRLRDRSAVNPLIDALITTHAIRMNPQRYDEPIQVQFVTVRNTEVLAALKELTENTGGYGYDQRAWKQWQFLRHKQLAAEETMPINIRREPR